MTDITKEQLNRKDIEEWSEAEKEAAEQMSHTLTASYLTVRKLAAQGSKTQTYEEIIQDLLDEQTAPLEVSPDV